MAVQTPWYRKVDHAVQANPHVIDVRKNFATTESEEDRQRIPHIIDFLKVFNQHVASAPCTLACLLREASSHHHLYPRCSSVCPALLYTLFVPYLQSIVLWSKVNVSINT